MICKKGQIYFVKNDPENPPFGSETWADRMAVIVSNDVNNKYSNTVMVVYLTTKKKKICPTHVEVQSSGRTAIACCEQIDSVDKKRLTSCAGEITFDEKKDIDKAILFALQISNTLRPTGIFSKWEHYIQTKHLGPQMASGDERLQELIKERDAYKQLYKSYAAKLAKIETIAK